EIPGISVGGINFRDALEIVDGTLGIAGVLGHQAEVVPCIRIFRILFQRVVESRFGLVNLLKIQFGDALVEPSNRELWISFSSLLELLQRFFKKLLVHVGAAEIV